MKPLTFRTWFILLLFGLGSWGCSTTDAPRSCEIIANAQSSNFLKVINQSSSKILVEFGTIPFAAVMQLNACELTGLATGAHYVEISKCEGQASNCSSIGSVVREDFALTEGETHSIIVTDSYF